MSISKPTRSPFGANAALDQLAQQLKSGEAPVNAQSARKLMDVASEDGRLTVEEAQTLDGLQATIAGAKDASAGHTELGRELMQNFVRVARGRLSAAQINSEVSPMNMWMKASSFGFWSMPAPSYIGVDQNVRSGGTTRSLSEAATDKALEALASPHDLDRMLEDYPAAVAKPGNSYELAVPQPEVRARYQQLLADIRGGAQVDEQDPMSAMRSYLEQSYA